jgi:site-specific DNA recombinase
MEKDKTLKLIGYCRVSTENQKEEGTIDLQIRDIKKFADSNNYDLVETFCDNGVSGSLEWFERKGMLEMFNYLEQHKDVDGVLIYKLDRLARDLRIQENIIYDLQEKQKKTIISIKEPDLDSKDITRVLFRQMLSAVAQYERGLITMRMMNGRLRKAEKGGYAGGSVAYGYVCKNKELKIDRKQAEVVKLIFQLRKKRKSLREIVAILNSENIKTARGGKWYAGTVRYILKNSIYKGRVVYKGVSAEKFKLLIL